ncbi:MAG: methylenetetrahydrofolate reductase [Acidimicrobiales bacterium]|nr:methylenetetrahydrofolate reductase [Acidimicrobiales bacterium]
MTKISREDQKASLSFSLEIFPPRTDSGNKVLLQQLPLLETIKPRTICVTSGAGGSNKGRTLKTIKALDGAASANPTAHLTCSGSSKEETHNSLDQYASENIFNIVALRGDPSEKMINTSDVDEYENAAEFVSGIRSRRDGHKFHISVAAYPEIHPKARSKEADVANLKAKIDHGADLILTQFFFEPDIFFRFMDDIEKVGIEAPIAPGIMVISNFERICNFASKCGASIPEWMTERFFGLAPGSDQANVIAEEIALDQCSALADQGIRKFHFYTLNRIDLTAPICQSLMNTYSSAQNMDSSQP